MGGSGCVGYWGFLMFPSFELKALFAVFSVELCICILCIAGVLYCTVLFLCVISVEFVSRGMDFAYISNCRCATTAGYFAANVS